jgi:membrane-associated phospholipid phosphatase
VPEKQPGLVPVEPPPLPQSGRAAFASLARPGHSAPEAREAARRSWGQGCAIGWNCLARDLVAGHRIDPLAASRLYAILSVAQHDAGFYARRAQDRLGQRPTDGSPYEQAAVLGASRAVLLHFFPSETPILSRRSAEFQDRLQDDARAAAVDVAGGDAWGERIGQRTVAHAASDGAAAAATNLVDCGAEKPGHWRPGPGRGPLLPSWATIRPWLLGDVVRFRAPPPPRFGSPAFDRALAEVRRLSDTSTLEQRRIAALWADGLGSYTPAGRWNKIAEDLVVTARLPESQAVRVLTLVNLALMDAGIACWDSKFHYWVLRPSQADPKIATPVGLPEFPSYTSAHATFSGAASGVLAELFPERAAFLNAKAHEASVSRMYGGIHYRFDADAGLAQGRAVAQVALAWGRNAGITGRRGNTG